jgi:hypothetical protein
MISRAGVAYLLFLVKKGLFASPRKSLYLRHILEQKAALSAFFIPIL